MIIPLVLLGLSAVTHFAFFGWPAQVVFDEVYFASFVQNYSTGAYYFDIHPPLAKLLTVGFGNIIGAPTGVDVSTIGNALPWEIILLRILPILAGIFLPVVIYYICRHLNFSRLVAFTAGMLIILENSLLVQSRFLLFDSILLLFGFTSILMYLVYVRRGEGRALLLVSAVLAAGAFSTKWTGLAYPLLIFIAEIVRVKKVKPLLKFTAIYAGVGIFVYFSVFAVHFAYLTKTGPGDLFMTERFQMTLEGNPFASNENIVPKKFFGKAFELNYQMYEANRTLDATHQYSSGFLTWPLMLRGVFYWQGVAKDGVNAYIYLLGNPLVYWFGGVAMLILMARALKKRMSEKVSLFIITGFLVNFLPFILIGRVMFLYHYEAALIFTILALCWLIELWVPEKRKLLVVLILLGICLATFVFLSPLSYGLSLTDSQLKSRMWLPTWR